MTNTQKKKVGRKESTDKKEIVRLYIASSEIEKRGGYDVVRELIYKMLGL